MSAATRPTRTRHRNRIIAGSLVAVVALPALSYGFSLLAPPTTTREVEINASPDEVWEVLTDFPSYPEWHPHITRIEGTPEVGQQLDFDNTSGGSAMRFTPKVLIAEPGVELRWVGHVAFPGLLDGEHSFTLVEGAGGTTRLIQSESFTGILAPLSPLMMDLGAAFESANLALRDRLTAVR